MAKKSMAELIYTAYLTGDEAQFTDNGITYTFTPQGLKDYITVGAATQYTDTMARDAIKTKTEIDALVSPTADYADLEEATAAIKAVIDALKA